MLRVDSVVADAHSNGMRVLLDVHNYAIYYGSVIGSQKLPPSTLGNLWGRIARRYKNKDWVIFGLMNEPKDLQSETWLEAVNIAISEIRQTGASNMIFVPGNGWSSARTWSDRELWNAKLPKLCSAFPILTIISHMKCISILTPTIRGQRPHCQDVDVGSEALTPFTQWARSHRNKRISWRIWRPVAVKCA